MSKSWKSYIYIYILVALCSITTFAGFWLASDLAFADDAAVDTINLTIPEACTLSTPTGSGQTYNAQLANGQYKNDIGKTRLSVFCNTQDSFAVYAVGYSNDTIGNNEMITTTSGATNILTGTATSGDTSNWAMKIEPVTGTAGAYTPTVLSPFNDFTAIPSDYAKIAEVSSVTTGTTAEAAIDTNYAVYISPKQSSGSYQGKVKYTMVHPHDANPPKKVAYLDTGTNVQKKIEDGGGCFYLYKWDTLPTNFIPSEANTISLPGSPAPVYVDTSDYYNVGIFTTAEVVYMNKDSSHMFEYLGGGENCTIKANALGNWDSSYVEDMSYMFYAAVVNGSNLINLNTSNVKNMRAMFFSQESASSGCTNCDENTFAGWDVSNVTDMYRMFDAEQNYCQNEFAPVTDSVLRGMANWDVKNVTNMNGMFMCNNFSDLAPLANWNVGNVTNMAYMFAGIPTLTNSQPIKNWDVTKVNNSSSGWGDGFYEMFGSAYHGYPTPTTNLPIFTSRPGTWDSEGTYIPN